MANRDNQIVELVHRYGELSVQELGDLLELSTSSVRRDLITLNDHRFVDRTHGGVKISTVVSYELLWIHRTPVERGEAKQIAFEAAQMINPGDVIAISGGEICTELSLLVRLKSDITIVTNAVNVAAELACLNGIQVRMTGGRLNPGSFELVGQVLEPSLGGIHIQKYFVGTDGLSVEYGVTAHDEAEADATRVLMAHSDQTIVLADSRKFKIASFAQVAPISRFSIVITTGRVPAGVRAEFEDAGINVHIAQDT